MEGVGGEHNKYIVYIDKYLVHIRPPHIIMKILDQFHLDLLSFETFVQNDHITKIFS